MIGENIRVVENDESKFGTFSNIDDEGYLILKQKSETERIHFGDVSFTPVIYLRQDMKVYLDNSATTPIHPKVLEKMLPYLKENFGNPSSIHSFGRNVRVAIEEARENIADFINADASEIYFTSNGTEALNFSLIGMSKSIYEENGKK